MGELERSSLQAIVQGFLTDVASIRSNAVFTGMLIQGVEVKSAKDFQTFLKSCASRADGSEIKYTIPPAMLGRFRKLQYAHQRAQRGRRIASRGFIVSLVSQYDAFLSALVRATFIFQPAFIKSSRKTIDVADVLTFTSIEDVTNAIMDDEIEALLRESHREQFTWLENKFDIKTLRKDLAVWPAFVELTQRRNLFVHSDGKVSKQYLKVCGAEGVTLENNLSVGSQLDADISYVRRSADVLFEIGVKLSQVIWRKTRPKDLEAADESLNGVAYKLLEERRYKLAVTILDFAFEVLKKHSTAEAKLRMLVNRANAYRLAGNKQRCLDLISAEDWSATSLPFRLASTVLREDFRAAIVHMRAIGAKGDIGMEEYRIWPLFEGIRETEEFTSTFREIFGEDLVRQEEVAGPHEDGQTAADRDVDSLLALLDAEEPFHINFETSVEQPS